MFARSMKQLSYIPKNRLDGKVAVVTASTNGIGLAIAKRLAQEGAKVVISSRKQQNVDKAISSFVSEGLGNSVVGTVCHVANAEDRKKIFQEANKLGGVDILVSNAGTNPVIGSVLDSSQSNWDKIFDTNVKSAFLLAKEALPFLRKSTGGRIIFVSSIAGYRPFQLLGVYSVSKTALIGLSKAISEELAIENITVNCIAPGVIETKFSEALTTEGPIRDRSLSDIPMNRFGTPEEIAGVAAFLASDDARYITGETIVAGGGMSSRL